MPIQGVRIANFFLIALIFASGHLYCLWYIGAMHLSLEVLNTQKIYLQHACRVYNAVFWCYELVLAERLFQHHVSDSFEWLLNCMEHIGFGIITCLKIYIYTDVFLIEKHLPAWKRGLLAFAMFNIVGAVNEIFQNFLSSRSLFVFVDDSIKDMQMNVAGGLFFLLAVAIRICWLKYNDSHRHYPSL